jgi:hypothetical protein
LIFHLSRERPRNARFGAIFAEEGPKQGKLDMRLNMTHVSLTLMAIGFASGSSLAKAQWEVRPAPSSWGLPAPQSQSQQAPVTNKAYAANPPLTQSSTSLNDAVSCSAALQLATMAAPNWARERAITTITNAWLQRVFALGEGQGVAGDQVPAVVEREMQRQIDGTAADPAILSRRAFDCASRQP